MRSKKVWRYYCDFCKRAGLGKSAMVKHEARCFQNPARICGLCEEADEGPQVPIADLMACLNIDKEDFGMKELRELARECPACIMAAIFQRKLQSHEDFKSEGPLNYNFNYKTEMEQWHERMRPINY